MLARVGRAALVALLAVAVALVPLSRDRPPRTSSRWSSPPPARRRIRTALSSPWRSCSDGIASNWGFTLTGTYWTVETYRPVVAMIWQTLDAISCTPYLTTLHSKVGALELRATSIGGWVAGDYGLSKRDAVSLDFPQLLTSYQTDPGHVSRLFVHEVTHAYSRDRSEGPTYWTDFTSLYNKLGRFGSYGGSASETFSEVVGYYVARCAANNPYTTAKAGYYDFVKTEVFGGREFGPALGQTLVCDRSARRAPPTSTRPRMPPSRPPRRTARPPPPRSPPTALRCTATRRSRPTRSSPSRSPRRPAAACEGEGGPGRPGSTSAPLPRAQSS